MKFSIIKFLKKGRESSKEPFFLAVDFRKICDDICRLDGDFAVSEVESQEILLEITNFWLCFRMVIQNII